MKKILICTVIVCYSTFCKEGQESTVMSMAQSVLKSILEEEQERLKQLEKELYAQYDSLPRGYLLKRRLRGGVYYYLSYREEGRVKQEYLGKLQKDEVKNYKERIEKKKRIRKELRNIRKRLEKLQKAIKRV